MDPEHPDADSGRPNDRILFFPGTLIALGTILTLTGIGAFMASGALDHVPQGIDQIAIWMGEEPPLLVLSGYLSIAGNVALAIGALMLAHLAGWAPHRREEVHRVDLPGLWAALVFAVILIMPYDLALPRGLIPLAASDASSPLFVALYKSLDLTHSVGLVVFYIATTALFVHQARTATGQRSRWGWRIAAGISGVAIVVALGLVIERPPAFLVPAVFLTWFAMLWLGLRMAWGTAAGAPDALVQPQTGPVRTR